VEARREDEGYFLTVSPLRVAVLPDSLPPVAAFWGSRTALGWDGAEAFPPFRVTRAELCPDPPALPRSAGPAGDLRLTAAPDRSEDTASRRLG
jgi:hypothetical protein